MGIHTDIMLVRKMYGVIACCMNELTSELCTCNMNRSSMYRNELCAQPVHPLCIASATTEQSIPHLLMDTIVLYLHAITMVNLSVISTPTPHSVLPWTPLTQLVVSPRAASG